MRRTMMMLYRSGVWLEQARATGEFAGRIPPCDAPDAWKRIACDVALLAGGGRLRFRFLKDCAVGAAGCNEKEGREELKVDLSGSSRDYTANDDADAAAATLVRWCGDAKAVSLGMWVHACFVENGQDRETFLGNLLVQMYGKCGRVLDARAVFDKIERRNLFSWNIMIAAYSQNGYAREALQLYGQMQVEGVNPERFTFTPILSACASLGALAEGRLIHARIVAAGLQSSDVTGNALLYMYGKCHCLKDARGIFDNMHRRNVASWNAIIAAYVQNGQCNEALRLFQQMDFEGFKPDKITFLTILEMCSSSASLAKGRAIHALIVTSGLSSDTGLGNALVKMYGKCGGLNDARAVFDKMNQRSVVSWTSMITACVQNEEPSNAIELFGRMDVEGVRPDAITFLSILDACAS
eukprot:c24006_g14_i1 orf=49-1281(+)